MTLFTSLFRVKAADASSVDAIAQWVAASAAKMPLPKIPINATSLGECQRRLIRLWLAESQSYVNRRI
jgi:hypothetical protein